MPIEGMKKICGRCKIEKPLDEFSKCITKKDGLQWQCNDCLKKIRQQLKNRDLEKINYPKTKVCKKCNIEKTMTGFSKDRYNVDGLHYLCKSCRRCYRKEKWEKNKSAELKLLRELQQEARKRGNKFCNICNTEKALSKFNKNKCKLDGLNTICRECARIYYRNKRKTDINFKLGQNLRRRLNRVLKGNIKSASAMRLIGCSIEKVRQHLELQFQPGMTWDNWNRTGWHIDHIIPCYIFDLSDPKQQKKCFHYTNLRPLWAKENLRRKRNGMMT